MKRFFTTSGVLATAVMAGLLFVVSSGVVAQDYGSTYTTSGYGYRYVPSWGGGWGGWRSHSSTYEEGVLRGSADLTRAAGEANLYNSMAAEHYESARRAAIENKRLATQTFFDVREINRQAREAQRPTRLTTDQYADLAQRKAPAPLAAQQYEPTTGKLAWPDVLRGKEFAAERQAIDEAFRSRGIDEGGRGSQFSVHVARLASSMQTELKSKIQELRPMDYMAAKKFLDSVSYEAMQPYDLRAVATR